MKVVSKSIELAGRTLTLEVGRLAQQATTAVFAKYGETSLLATVVFNPEETKLDYFPLTVDYQERLYAGGRIKGSRWVKREGRPTDNEILSGRLIDRSIRPLFASFFRHDVQVIITVLSVDVANDPDVLGIVATSAALAISPVPWAGPVGAVRLGLEDGQLVVNPANGNRPGAQLDLVVTSTDKLICMIEAAANQVPEEQIGAALEMGLEQNRKTIALIAELVQEVGVDKIAPPAKPGHPPDLLARVKQAWKANPQAVVEGFAEADQAEVALMVEELAKSALRQNLLTKKKRPDGRKADEIRPLDIAVGVLPRVHGSALFARGETQVLTVATLGAPSLSQSLESAEGEETKRYMHHYNFPPFSTGETGRMGAPGRREIGHGALAERAILPVIPVETDFPYAIRVVSEILSSNGSTSMASVCGSSLALMDAGVPVASPVAGISMGLVTPDAYPKLTDGYLLLTDITGTEDQSTDMDFKVAGTSAGVTAIQLDVKVAGLTAQICQDALTQALVARGQILAEMQKVISGPRPALSPYAPKISTTQIPVDKIGELIGPGGKVIRKLMADSETSIDVNDDGSVFVSGSNQDGVNKALAWIKSLGKEVKPGEIYEGTVARIQPFGAFVNILPGKDGLVHVSQMGSGFVSDPRQVVKEDQGVRVWVTDIDAQGRINLSMLFDAAGLPLVKPRPPRRPARPAGGPDRPAGRPDRFRRRPRF